MILQLLSLLLKVSHFHRERNFRGRGTFDAIKICHVTSFLSPLLPNKIATSLWRIFFKRKCIWRRVSRCWTRQRHVTWPGFYQNVSSCRVPSLSLKEIRFFRRKRTTSCYPHHRRLSKGMSRDQVLRDNCTTSHYPHYYWIRQRHVTWRARYAPSLFPLKAIPFHSRMRILSFY